jgi:aldose 1-epimerase
MIRLNSYVQLIDFHGQSAIEAGNDYLSFIVVPSWGSNLISLTHKQKNVQLLRVPESREAYEQSPVLYGTPILFPPNRIADGVLTYENKTYQFPINEPERNNHIHGFVYDKKWKLVDYSANSDVVQVVTEFNSADYPEIYKYFPHHFSMRMTYRLEGTELKKIATIYNHGKEPFPWGFGYHTTLQLPFQPGTSLEKCYFTADVEKCWQLNDRFLPTGELITAMDVQQKTAINSKQYDDVFLAVPEGEVMIWDENIDIVLSYENDAQFKHWVLYNGDAEQGLFCPEPYTWVTNAPNVDLPDEITGMQVLQPDEQVELVSTLRLDEILVQNEQAT